MTQSVKGDNKILTFYFTGWCSDTL